MSALVLFDAPGPKARRRILFWSALAILAVLGVAAWVIVQLAEKGQFDAEKWLPFVQEEGLFSFMAQGLGLTLAAAGAGLIFAFALGVLLVIGRLSKHAMLRRLCAFVVEILRGAPVLLLMLFFFIAFPALFKVDLPVFWAVVFALTLFNGAVISEIIRAGVASLPKGQGEAALALGMRNLQVTRLVLLPQALRVMLPTLVSQFIVLLKDTSLGFIIGYTELLQRGQIVSQLFNNPLQTFFLIGVVYIILNSIVSRLSHWLSSRQSKRPNRTPSGTKLQRPITAAITLGVRQPRSRSGH